MCSPCSAKCYILDPANGCLQLFYLSMLCFSNHPNIQTVTHIHLKAVHKGPSTLGVEGEHSVIHRFSCRSTLLLTSLPLGHRCPPIHGNQVLFRAVTIWSNEKKRWSLIVECSLGMIAQSQAWNCFNWSEFNVNAVRLEIKTGETWLLDIKMYINIKSWYFIRAWKQVSLDDVIEKEKKASSF